MAELNVRKFRHKSSGCASVLARQRYRSNLPISATPTWGCHRSDRYWIGQEGEGYGPCHNGPRYDSGPPSIWPNGQYVKYKTNDNNDPC